MSSLSRHACVLVPLALLALSSVGASAQQPVTAPCPPGKIVASACPVRALTLADAVATAQRQGLSAEASRQTLVEARARNAGFSARLLPQLSLDAMPANYNRGFIPVVLPTGETQFASQSQNESTAGLTVSQSLPWMGSTLTVGSYIDRLDLTGSVTSRTYRTTPFLVTLRQDLLKPRELLWDARSQDLRSGLWERQYLESREDLAINTASAFFDYYAATVAVQNAATNVAVNDTLYTLNKGRFEVGKIGENDLLQSELQLLRARASLDGAKLERDRSESALRRLINVHGPDTLAVVPPQDAPTV